MLSMPFEKTRENQVSIPFSPSEHDRLKYHAARLNWKQSELVRGAVFDRLNQLDEQEAFERQSKEARRRGATKIGRVPTVHGEEYDRNRPLLSIPSLPGGLMPIGPRAEDSISPKFDEAIGRWVRMVDESEGSFDRESRMLIVRGAAKEKGATPEQIEKIITAVHEKLAARAQASTEKLAKAAAGVPISGDVD